MHNVSQQLKHLLLLAGGLLLSGAAMSHTAADWQEIQPPLSTMGVEYIHTPSIKRDNQVVQFHYRVDLFPKSSSGLLYGVHSITGDATLQCDSGHIDAENVTAYDAAGGVKYRSPIAPSYVLRKDREKHLLLLKRLCH